MRSTVACDIARAVSRHWSNWRSSQAETRSRTSATASPMITRLSTALTPKASLGGVHPLNVPGLHVANLRPQLPAAPRIRGGTVGADVVAPLKREVEVGQRKRLHVVHAVEAQFPAIAGARTVSEEADQLQALVAVVVRARVRAVNGGRRKLRPDEELEGGQPVVGRRAVERQYAGLDDRRAVPGLRGPASDLRRSALGHRGGHVDPDLAWDVLEVVADWETAWGKSEVVVEVKPDSRRPGAMGDRCPQVHAQCARRVRVPRHGAWSELEAHPRTSRGHRDPRLHQARRHHR